MMTSTSLSTMPTKTRSSPIRRIPRALLLPVGEDALAVAEQIDRLSRGWLGGEPPVAIAEQATWMDADKLGLAAALDRLSSQELMADLAQRGVSLERNNEIQAWVLVQLGHEDNPKLTPTDVVDGLDSLADLSWERLRVHTVPHVLFLAEPAEQGELADWVSSLVKPCGDRIYVAGPVTHDHVRLTPEMWLPRAATGVSALLWSAPPSHTQLARTLQTGQQIQALGAAAWLSPLPSLRTYLAEAFARRVLARLHEEGETDGRPAQAPAPALIQEGAGPEQEVRSLTQTLPAPGAGSRWGNRRPGLTALATLPADLRREGERRDKQRQMDLRRARQGWLAERLAGWQDALARRRQESLAPIQAWPDLTAYRVALQAQRAQALQSGEVVEGQLESWGDRVAQAENRVDAAAHALQGICDLFPTPDLRGVVTLLTRPWRMFGWAWAYLNWLPKRAQQMLDAQAQRAQLQWQDANWHVIRQFYLAQAQDLQLELVAVEKIQAVMASACQSLNSADPVQARDLPPWTPAALDALSDHIFADDGVCVWGFLETLPLSQWSHQSGEILVRQLTEWTAPWLTALDGWTAVDCAAAALSDPALALWLSSLAEQATPLWPDQELQAENRGENRLLLPPILAASQDPGQGERLRRVQAAAKAISDVMQTVCHADALAWVRLSAVDLVLDLPEMAEDPEYEPT